MFEKIKSLFLNSREDISIVSKTISFALYTDKTIRAEEELEAKRIIKVIFEDDEQSVIDGVFLLVMSNLDLYSKDINNFYKDKDFVFKQDLEIIETILEKIFYSDLELHSREKNVLEEYKNRKKNKK